MFKKDIFISVLRTELKRKKYTQEIFAEKIGVSYPALKKYMSTKCDELPRIDIIYKMSEVLGVSIDYLVGNMPERNYDYKFIHEETGLSVESIEKITINKSIRAFIEFILNSDSKKSYLMDFIGVFGEYLENLDFHAKCKEELKYFSREYDYMVSDDPWIIGEYVDLIRAEQLIDDSKKDVEHAFSKLIVRENKNDSCDYIERNISDLFKNIYDN